jgi:hypothetical protein
MLIESQLRGRFPRRSNSSFHADPPVSQLRYLTRKNEPRHRIGSFPIPKHNIPLTGFCVVLRSDPRHRLRVSRNVQTTECRTRSGPQSTSRSSHLRDPQGAPRSTFRRGRGGSLGRGQHYHHAGRADIVHAWDLSTWFFGCGPQPCAPPRFHIRYRVGHSRVSTA